MPTTDRIKARIAGKNLTLKIDREYLSLFEIAEGVSAYALFRTMHAGAWTISQIRSVLRFASLGPSTLAQAQMMAKHLSIANLGYGQPTGPDTSHIDGALSTNPPAVYAPLAMAILGAALFGLAEEDATFTDKTPA